LSNSLKTGVHANMMDSQPDAPSSVLLINRLQPAAAGAILSRRS
jgi:hypothetical protein